MAAETDILSPGADVISQEAGVIWHGTDVISQEAGVMSQDADGRLSMAGGR
jgi:hypothetical protein